MSVKLSRKLFPVTVTLLLSLVLSVVLVPAGSAAELPADTITGGSATAEPTATPTPGSTAVVDPAAASSAATAAVTTSAEPTTAAEPTTTADALSTTSPSPAAEAPSVATTPSAPPAATPTELPSATPAPAVRRAPSELKIMNYYPADASWSAMWTSYSHARTDSDFADIASLGANTVRIIVQPKAVGWPTVTATGAATLADLVDTAAAHGLDVELTLFDLWYGWSDIPTSKTWAAQLLSPYAGDPRIVLVELQNELNTSYGPALTWAQSMLPHLQTLLPGVPRSLSTNTVSALQTLTDALPAGSVDVIDIHLYGSISTMPGYIATAKSIAAGRPVIVGEAGRSTGPGGTTGAEQGQVSFYQAVTQLVRAEGIGVFAPWILSDFTPAGMPAAFQGATEPSFGLRRLDGSWKPAAEVVRSMFTDPDSYQVPAGQLAAAALGYDGSFTNEDGEQYHLGWLGSWRTFDATAAGVIGTVDGGVDSGAAGILAQTEGSAAAVPALYQTFLLLNGSRTVRVKAQLKLDAATGFSRVAIAWFDGASYLGSSESVNAKNATTGWQSIALTGTAPARATSFQIHLKSAYNSGTALFDAVTISGAA